MGLSHLYINLLTNQESSCEIVFACSFRLWLLQSTSAESCSELYPLTFYLHGGTYGEYSTCVQIDMWLVLCSQTCLLSGKGSKAWFIII